MAAHPFQQGIVLQEEALKLAVELASEYIKHRPLHIKTLNLIRTAGSAVLEAHQEREDKEAAPVIDPLSVATIVEDMSHVPASDLVANTFKRLLRH